MSYSLSRFSSAVWASRTKSMLVYFYISVGSGMFLQELFKTKILDRFKIGSDSSAVLLEFHNTCTTDIKLH